MSKFSQSVSNFSLWIQRNIEEVKRRKPEREKPTPSKSKKTKPKRRKYSCKDDEYQRQKPTCRTNGKQGH
jgi:hypothetical protein